MVVLMTTKKQAQGKCTCRMDCCTEGRFRWGTARRWEVPGWSLISNIGTVSVIFHLIFLDHGWVAVGDHN